MGQVGIMLDDEPDMAACGNRLLDDETWLLWWQKGEASGIDIDWLIGNHYSNRQSRSISTWSLILYHKFIIYSNMM